MLPQAGRDLVPPVLPFGELVFVLLGHGKSTRMRLLHARYKSGMSVRQKQDATLQVLLLRNRACYLAQFRSPACVPNPS